MDIDYNKIVDFILLGNIKTNGISNVLKEILKDYCMISVDKSKKGSEKVFLKRIETRKEFIMQRRRDAIVIIPSDYNMATLGDNFEEMIEIRVNDDDNVILSNIKMCNKPEGVYVTTSSWHNAGDNSYIEGVNRIMFFDKSNIEQIANKESIAMFMSKNDLKRNDIFHDLYWDMDMVRKSMFIEPKINERIQITDGYTKEKFPDLYKKFQDKIKEILGKNSISSYFKLQ